MKRRALRKDFYMEIRTSLNRFFSIFLIVALGVAFFAGIRATNPDMRITVDTYFDDSNLMDLRIASTMGLTKEDVTAISNVEGVEAVEPSYSTHVVCDVDGNELVLEVMSSTKKLNQIMISEGRLPEKADEVLVDTFFITETGYTLGDKIKVSSGTEKNISETLNQDEFTIVGIGNTAYYLSFQRGSSNIGSGDVNSFIVVLPEVFSLEAYTGVYVAVEDAKGMTVYTDKYDDQVDVVQERIKKIADVQCQIRYEKLYEPANEEIIKSRRELEASRVKADAEIDENLNNLSYAGLSEEQLLVAKQKIENTKQETEKQFKEAEDKIREAETELAKLEVPTWYVLDRGSMEAYVEFEQNADRIGAIGEVFPAIFFLVAALISLTTMTRMVEEERIQIGTLKALGYSKVSIAMKYMLYALLATLGGSLFGAIVGLKVLPTVIITAYKIMYRNIPEVITPFNIYYAALATILAVLCVGFATFIACYKELLAKPAELMRPEAPKNGKRVLLERVPFIWNRLTFTWKATIRNLLRYKKRFFMTIFGIGGCMALLLVGFGLKDSIFVIYTRQFDEIMLYDASISRNKKATEDEISDLENKLEDNKNITSSIKIQNSSAEISFQGKTKSLTLFVPEDSKEFEDYIVFRKRVGHKNYALTDSGVILTEQIAKTLGINIGDTISMKKGDEEVEVEVSAITENYMTHYVYMTPALYETVFKEKADYNEYFLMMPEVDKEEMLEVGNDLLKLPATAGVFYTSHFQELLSNILVSLNIVVWVLIIAAGALAFVVLYNLNNININERRRELATIKVLGFYNNEMAAYVYRENILLTIVGAAFGVIFGILLHHFVIITVEIDMVMFGRNIDPTSYLYSILLTFFFSAFVNFVMFFKLKKINMVESLKSVE
jgi:putative ABC transport system permease protein